MSRLKSLSFEILVIAVLALRCGAHENSTNVLGNSTDMEELENSTNVLSNSTEMEELPPPRISDNMNALEGKFNELAANVSSLLLRKEEKDAEYAENMTLQLNESNGKLLALADKLQSVDSRLNDLESKLNALTTAATDFVAKIKDVLFIPFSSCEDVFASPLVSGRSGVYKIQPNGSPSPFAVYCMVDPKGGRPWTVLQRRIDNSTDFYRNWSEYQRGFGDMQKNFFIGLEMMHSLTTEGEPQELWVMVTDPKGVSAHAYYDRFAIGNEAEKYPLEVLGAYSGDAGDSLTHQKSMKFSTFDSDNDLSAKNCAKGFRSAWWFRNCHAGQLNGVYGSTEYGEGLNWKPFGGSFVSMAYAHMAIRPVRT